MTTSTPALALDGLRVRRGSHEVLHVERLEVGAGETVALLGPNGAGKSTLLLAAALLLRPAAGSLRLFGFEPSSRRATRELRRLTATVFQDPALLDASLHANVEAPLAIRGVPRAERRAAAEAWLHRLGVAQLAARRPHQVSGGEARRAALARAFVARPRLLLLDEPFASLDAETRAELGGELRTLLDAERTTTLLATHDRAEAQLLADRIVVLLDGRIAQQGAAAEVVTRPRTAPVAAFLGFSVLPASLLAAHCVPPPAGDAEAIAVPPDAASILLSAEPGAMPGRLLAIQPDQGRARAVVEVGAPLRLQLDLEAARALAPRLGGEVWVRLDGGRLLPLRSGTEETG